MLRVVDGRERALALVGTGHPLIGAEATSLAALTAFYLRQDWTKDELLALEVNEVPKGAWWSTLLSQLVYQAVDPDTSLRFLRKHLAQVPINAKLASNVIWMVLLYRIEQGSTTFLSRLDELAPRVNFAVQLSSLGLELPESATEQAQFEFAMEHIVRHLKLYLETSSRLHIARALPLADEIRPPNSAAVRRLFEGINTGSVDDVQGAALSFSRRELPALALALPRLNAMSYPQNEERYLVRFLIERWNGTLTARAMAFRYALRRLPFAGSAKAFGDALRRRLPFARRRLWD
jgi:hypothetical protein